MTSIDHVKLNQPELFADIIYSSDDGGYWVDFFSSDGSVAISTDELFFRSALRKLMLAVRVPHGCSIYE